MNYFRLLERLKITAIIVHIALGYRILLNKVIPSMKKNYIKHN